MSSAEQQQRARPASGGTWPARLARVLADPALVQVALQPIVDLSRGSVAGFEALARLPGPGGPEGWFVAAAEQGLADAFEATVVERTLARRGELPPNAFLSVNLSPAALLGPQVQRVLERTGGLAGVVVELTERAAVEDYAALVEAVAGVRAQGGLIAVDDMGAGHASLSHVLRLRPDFVKLDRDLVADCDRDEARLAVLEMLGVFAGRIDAWVVAEGIERQSELEAVARIGLPLAQGYHLGRPGPVAAGLRPELAASLARTAQRRAGAGLGALVEPAPLLAAGDDAAVAAAWAQEDPPAAVVLVDAAGRPTGLVPGPGRPRADATTTGVGDDPGEVAQRAMARPAARRFDPLVVCDDLGHAMGIVRLERLVDHLAGA